MRLNTRASYGACIQLYGHKAQRKVVSTEWFLSIDVAGNTCCALFHDLFCIFFINIPGVDVLFLTALFPGVWGFINLFSI